MTKPQDLDGVVAFLDQATHPEIHHFREGSHPGLGWWLKTVCPNPQDFAGDPNGFGRSWRRFALKHPDLVCLMPVALDWTGQPIAGFWSVWVADDHDVRMIPAASGLDLERCSPRSSDLATAQELLDAAGGLDGPEGEAIRRAADAVKLRHEPAIRRELFHVVRKD